MPRREQTRQWTPQETTFLIQAYSQEKASIKSICVSLGRSIGSIERKLRSLISTGSISGRGSGYEGKSVELKFDNSNQVNYTDFLRISGNVICSSDVHVPFWSAKLFGYIFAIAKKFKIKKLIFNGDFLNLDSFSRWVTGMRGRKETEMEFNKATAILIECLKVFDKIYITEGNHEARLFNALSGQVPCQRFLKMIQTAEMDKRIVASDYPYCEVNGEWIVGHPKGYSDRGGQTPTDISDVFDKNVITGHNHQWGMQTSRNGKHIGADHGMSADEMKIEYHRKTLGKNRMWQNGFSMIYNNHLYLFNLRFTDWDFWLNKINIK